MTDTSADELAARRQQKAKQPQYCFTCPCDNQVFVLRPDARIECGSCGQIQTQLMWGQYFVSATTGVASGPIPPGDSDSDPG